MARVGDAFEIKASYGLDSSEGLVVVLDGFPSPNPDEFTGRPVEVRTEAGRRFAARVAAARDHGPTISLLLAGLGREDVPIGSSIVFAGEPRA